MPIVLATTELQNSRIIVFILKIESPVNVLTESVNGINVLPERLQKYLMTVFGMLK